MSKAPQVAFETTAFIRDHCLCLHTQRAARVLARRFDHALGPIGLTNGQFSMLMALNRPERAGMGSVAALLGMDRTTLTAALKPLERRGLVTAAPLADDERSRRLRLTEQGQPVLAQAVPIWAQAHAEIDHLLTEHQAGDLRPVLNALR